jgi:hypothetical protein
MGWAYARFTDPLPIQLIIDNFTCLKKANIYIGPKGLILDKKKEA